MTRAWAMLAGVLLGASGCVTARYRLDLLEALHDEHYDLQHTISVPTPMERVRLSLESLIRKTPAKAAPRPVEDPGMLCRRAILGLTETLPRDLAEYARALSLLGPVSALGESPLCRAHALRTMIFLRGKFRADPPLAPVSPLEPKEGEDALGRLAPLLERIGKDPGDVEALEGCRREFLRLGRMRFELIGDAAAVLKLLARYGAPGVPPSVGEAAREAIHRVSERLVRLCHTSALRDSRPFVREDAIAGLRVLGSPDDAARVAVRLRADSSPSVRREAAQALASIGGDEGIPALIAALESDGDSGVRWNVLAALEAISGERLGGEPAPWRTWWARRRARKKTPPSEKASS